jgi:hypothetical protein
MAEGVRFVTLGEAAAEAGPPDALPVRALATTMLRGRSLPVSTGA